MPPARALTSPLARLAALMGPRPRLVVVGHGHVLAVARAARPGDRLLMENFGGPGPPTPGVLKRHPRSWRWRLERYRPDALVLSPDGNDHNILGLLDHPEPAPGQLVPVSMMRAVTAAGALHPLSSSPRASAPDRPKVVAETSAKPSPAPSREGATVAVS